MISDATRTTVEFSGCRCKETASAKHNSLDVSQLAFTDSTGAWGHAELEPAEGEESTYQFCGSKDGFRYDHETPYSCVGGQFMIPASIDYDGLALRRPGPHDDGWHGCLSPAEEESAH